jgi:hypothetical protein
VLKISIDRAYPQDFFSDSIEIDKLSVPVGNDDSLPQAVNDRFQDLDFGQQRIRILNVEHTNSN